MSDDSFPFGKSLKLEYFQDELPSNVIADDRDRTFPDISGNSGHFNTYIDDIIIYSHVAWFLASIVMWASVHVMHLCFDSKCGPVYNEY